ncbi:hypothetical protein Ppro_2583 [Pelobacter propionicus DSM 2379]|uniref:Uncharacterized protein n=1 Tax=Pelobacter propionicus (strain DSM 2379 / NBRC 103807 / OttBd1) TaxID=338966 RepID=A1AS67_PELPD|nr:hypothetical protein Ppro_2583 [Pelobacter propionicus DSM 2379]
MNILVQHQAAHNIRQLSRIKPLLPRRGPTHSSEISVLQLTTHQPKLAPPYAATLPDQQPTASELETAPPSPCCRSSCNTALLPEPHPAVSLSCCLPHSPECVSTFISIHGGTNLFIYKWSLFTGLPGSRRRQSRACTDAPVNAPTARMSGPDQQSTQRPVSRTKAPHRAHTEHQHDTNKAKGNKGTRKDSDYSHGAARELQHWGVQETRRRQEGCMVLARLEVAREVAHKKKGVKP